MPVKKKKNTAFTREERLFKSWWGLLILGPAVFFIYYLLTAGGPGSSSGNRVVIPNDYKRSGTAVDFDRGTITAAPGGRVIYSEKLVIGQNTMVPEGGKIFVVVPLSVPEGYTVPNNQCYIVSSGGERSNLLRTVNNNPAGSDIAGTLPGNRIIYLIFKPGKDQRDLYLVLSSLNPPAAWKLPPNSQG